MKKILAALTIAGPLVLNTYVSFADEKKSSGAPEASIAVTGVVVDGNANETLSGVSICLTETNQKVFTNSKGEFTLDKLLPGTYKVKASFISYKDKEITIRVQSGTNSQMTLELIPIEP